MESVGIMRLGEVVVICKERPFSFFPSHFFFVCGGPLSLEFASDAEHRNEWECQHKDSSTHSNDFE